MTGGAHKPDVISKPDPSPTLIPGREIDEAKKKVRRRGRGRQQNILAGRLTAQRSDLLNTRLG